MNLITEHPCHYCAKTVYSDPKTRPASHGVPILLTPYEDRGNLRYAVAHKECYETNHVVATTRKGINV